MLCFDTNQTLMPDVIGVIVQRRKHLDGMQSLRQRKNTVYVLTANSLSLYRYERRLTFTSILSFIPLFIPSFICSSIHYSFVHSCIHS